MKRSISLVIAALLAVSLAAPASAAYYESFGHPDVPFADMIYTGIDTDAVDAFCERFLHDPVGQYPMLLDLYDEVYTQNELAYIRMCGRAGDAALAAESERAEADFASASDAVYCALSKALDGPRGGALRALMPDGEADAFTGCEPLSGEETEGAAEEAALIRDYYLLSGDEDFEAAAAELYLRLAALRRAEAERAGFDSYPEYAYIVSFAREYAPEDVRALRSVVKSSIAPLYIRCVRALYAADPAWDDEDVPSAEEILDAIGAYIGDVSPELEESFDFLRRNGLYRIGGDELLDMGYTTSLPAYRSAFLFNKAATRFRAFEDTVHEFGHFNAAYHDPTPMLYQHGNIDVSELQSQGLELLFLPALQDILADGSPEDRSLVTLAVLTEMLGSVVDGCLYDEFEQAVYADPSLTADGLSVLEYRLCEEYGLNELYEFEADWPYIPHLFDQPCYYISYAASALPALDIWLLSLDDRDAAVDAYLKVSAARTDAWFFDVLYDNDLCGPTDRSDMSRLAAELEEQLEPLLGAVPAARSHAAVGIAAGAATVLGTVLTIHRKKRKMTAEREMEPAYAHDHGNDSEEIK